MRGGSQAQLLRCSDGNYYVVKFPNNPQGLTILANELLAGRLATLLGLPVPNGRIIQVSRELIEHTEEMRVDLECGRIPLKPGLCFGSQAPTYLIHGNTLLQPTYDFLPRTELPLVDNISDFASMLVFDKWTGNSDSRQAIFVRGAHRHSYKAWMVDQGHCFGGKRWKFTDIVRDGLSANLAVYAAIHGFGAFRKCLVQLEEKVNGFLLHSIADDIPPEWYPWRKRSLHRLLETLDQRREIVEKLLRNTCRAFPRSFPNWNGCAVANPNSFGTTEKNHAYRRDGSREVTRLDVLPQ